MTARPRILVVGASARAAAASAVRAGFAVSAVDLFGDADLRAVAETVAWSTAGLSETLRSLRGVPWMYVGGLENRPGFVRRLARTNPLWGVEAAPLRRVRDPLALQAVWREAGLPFPETLPAGGPPPSGGDWLRKQTCSAGGLGVTPFDSEDEAQSPPTSLRRRTFLQRRVEGEPWGATFVGDGRRATLLGATRQIVAADVDAARPFLYGGSIGPLPLDAATAEILQRLGATAVAAFGLRGLFGIDVVRDRHGAPWTLEINPRYTASIEIIERATAIRTIELHAAVFRGDARTSPDRTSTDVLAGKRIVYAADDRTVSPAFTARLLDEAQDAAWPEVADIPTAGTIVRAGTPLVTVFAAGPTVDDVELRLRRRAAELTNLHRSLNRAT